MVFAMTTRLVLLCALAVVLQPAAAVDVTVALECRSVQDLAQLDWAPPPAPGAASGTAPETASWAVIVTSPDEHSGLGMIPVHWDATTGKTVDDPDARITATYAGSYRLGQVIAGPGIPATGRFQWTVDDEPHEGPQDPQARTLSDDVFGLPGTAIVAAVMKDGVMTSVSASCRIPDDWSGEAQSAFTRITTGLPGEPATLASIVRNEVNPFIVLAAERALIAKNPDSAFAAVWDAPRVEERLLLATETAMLAPAIAASGPGLQMRWEQLATRIDQGAIDDRAYAYALGLLAAELPRPRDEIRYWCGRHLRTFVDATAGIKPDGTPPAKLLLALRNDYRAGTPPPRSGPQPMEKMP
jgi:hypothetical protein